MCSKPVASLWLARWVLQARQMLKPGPAPRPRKLFDVFTRRGRRKTGVRSTSYWPNNFTFTSANDDDHISKSAFKSNCWETQKDYIHHFDIERLFAQGNEAFVKYLCHTTNGKTFRNIEYVRTRGEQIESIECYFGGKSTFPSAVSTGKS